MAKQKKKKRKKTAVQKLLTFLRIQLVLALLAGGALAYYYVAGYASEVSALHKEAVDFVTQANQDTFRQAQTSIAYDVNDHVISVMKGEKDVYYVHYEEMPKYLIQAIVSIEDKRFYEHHGVDYKGVIRAIVAMFRDGEVTQGASTITQQLARGIFLTHDQTWERKIEEIYIAVELEKKFEKSEILEFYLNNIYYANGHYGIGAASKGYFNREPSQLSLSQLAFLCAIPNSPNKYDPLVNFDNTIERRNRILRNMLEDKLISEGTYMEALNEVITLEMPSSPEKNDYLSTYTYYCATRVLMAQEGFTFRNTFEDDEDRAAYEAAYDEAYDRCNESLYTGGYRIYTSLDMGIQEMLQYTLDQRLSGYAEVNEEGVYTMQGAAVVIDNITGMTRAIVGGRSQELTGYTLNRGYQSFRQPGSTIKPLVVYTPMLERGYTADSIVVDEEIEDGPKNADGGYAGEMTLRRAVEVSKNTVAWKLFEELTPKVGLSYLHKMDFARIVENDERPTSALGGLTYGVSALEMAKAYATIVNDGKYRDPNCVLKITDVEGNVLYQVEPKSTEVYDRNAARQMTDILEGVLTAGTGRGFGLSGTPCAAKTGTTNENKDGWFVGYTKYYTTSVWVGYDMPRALPGSVAGSYPGQIWQSIMTKLHTGLPAQDFSDPMTPAAPQVPTDTVDQSDQSEQQQPAE